jgi:PDZ domain-containing protein
VITSLLKDAPAADYGLLVNDRITAANGEQINSVGELRKILDAGSVRLKILRGRESIEVVVDVSDRGVLGVELAPVGLPQRIDPDSIRTEDVGGGSAGLMFTLALLDSNSDGDLSGGSKIAGTGTINPDGTVGPIVGASYKFIAAEAAGVEVFFVPSTLRSQLPKTSKVEIVAVDDVVDAVRWLCEHGGSSPELCRK